jgi:hypothetical protein
VDDYAAQTGLISPILTGGILLSLVVFWALLRYGIIDAPGWFPFWILYPEALIDYLF